MVTVKQKLSKEVLELFEKDNTINLVNEIEQKVIDDLIIKYDNHILEETKQRLHTYGFSFDTENDFINFCISRIQKIQYENKENYFELYLDYKSINDKGTLLLFGNDNIQVQSIENGKVTYTIG